MWNAGPDEAARSGTEPGATSGERPASDARPTSGDQRSTDARSSGRSPRTPPTVAVAGGKGGCGKTTTALAVARALVARGVPARAVDLDVGMPNLHRLAGVERDPTLAALAASAEGEDYSSPRTDEDTEPQTDDAGVAVVPAPRITAAVEPTEALARLPRADSVTLLDCPASAGPDATAPLRAASAVLLVATDRAESVEDAAKTGRMARSLDVPVVGAVVTRADGCSEGARCRLPTDHVVAVPEVDDPLADGVARRRYGTVAAWLEPRGRRPDRGNRSADRSARSPGGSSSASPRPMAATSTATEGAAGSGAADGEGPPPGAQHPRRRVRRG